MVPTVTGMPNLETARQRCDLAEATAKAARETLDEFLLELQQVEGHASRLRTVLRTTRENRERSALAARAAGLDSSESTRVSQARFVEKERATVAEVRSLIRDAEPLCDCIDLALDELHEARLEEKEAICGYLLLLEAHSTTEVCGAAPRIHQSAAATAPWVRTGGFIAIEQERKLERVVDADTKEQHLRTRIRPVIQDLPDEAHYDPQYDDVEILMRRMRPWV